MLQVRGQAVPGKLSVLVNAKDFPWWGGDGRKNGPSQRNSVPWSLRLVLKWDQRVGVGWRNGSSPGGKEGWDTMATLVALPQYLCETPWTMDWVVWRTVRDVGVLRKVDFLRTGQDKLDMGAGPWDWSMRETRTEETVLFHGLETGVGIPSQREGGHHSAPREIIQGNQYRRELTSCEDTLTITSRVLSTESAPNWCWPNDIKKEGLHEGHSEKQKRSSVV